MICNVAIVFAAIVGSHMCLASPVPDPSGHHRTTHIRVHIPHEVHTVHHHHVEKIPILKEVPVIKHVPVLHEVPVIKHVPILKEVHVPITVPIEKPVYVPVPYKESVHYVSSSWH